MIIERLKDLIAKYNAGQCTEEEKLSLEEWYLTFDWQTKPLPLAEDEISKLKEEAWVNLYKAKPNFDIKNKGRLIQMSQSKLSRWWLAASAILILASAAILYKQRPSLPIIADTQKPLKPKDLPPGESKARLILSNGSTIELDSLKKTKFVDNDGTNIELKEGEQLIYNNKTVNATAIAYNTLITPRGGEFKITLSDGTNVWLNSSSSLRYPTKFDTEERRVFLTGEAYFEVAKHTTAANKKRVPFIVKINSSSKNSDEIKVLGTHFNINAFEDEASVITTLLEGSVEVSAMNEHLLLLPGEQSQSFPNKPLKRIKNNNIDEVVAWKNGYFHFEKASLPTILRQFSRWYDVDVVYESALKNRNYFGIVSRKSSLKTVLKMLEANNISFEIDGKKLIVKSE